MNTNKTQLFLVASIASAMMLAGVASEQVFAHGGQGFFVTLPNGEQRQITVVIGHNDEPTRAQEKGKWAGEHPMELFIRDSATGLDLADAELVVDKYYYKDDIAFNKAMKKGFVPLETDVPISAVHGDPGHYFARQILAQPGIYGYHVTGTVSYFGVDDVEIDLKAFCRDAPENDFTSLWFGGFGCTTDIDDGKFPGKKVKHDKDD